MAASKFALACDALCRERDRVFLLRVSADYNIPMEELEAKYLTESEAALKVPGAKKAPRKAKVAVEGTKCQAMTAKKEQCSFSALPGQCFCKRHQKQQDEPKQEKPKAVKPPPAPKPAAKVEPQHAHAPTEEAAGPCELCVSHGDPLAEQPEEYEEVDELAPQPEPEDLDSAPEESDFDEE